MEKYQDNVQNRNGKAVEGASVRVHTYPAGDLATIYSDNGVTTAANPLTTDANGRFSFYVADGRYSLVIYGAGLEPQTFSDITIAEQLPPAIQFATFAAIVLPASPRFIVVAADETNDGLRTTYFFDGATLNWAPLVEI